MPPDGTTVGTVEPLITDSLNSGTLCYSGQYVLYQLVLLFNIVYLKPRIADTSKLRTTDNSLVYNPYSIYAYTCETDKTSKMLNIQRYNIKPSREYVDN